MKRTLIVVAAVLTASSASVWAQPPASAAPAETRVVPLVRKNVLELNDGEKRTFVQAVHRLKNTPSPYDPSLNYYDQFVEWHLTLYRCTGVDFGPTVGHGGSFFLPWHRVFLHLFERALREVSGKRIAIPYWDWSSQESTDAVFTQEFMGGDGDPNDGYAVKDGPFGKGNWSVTLAPENHPWATSYQPYLVRRFGSGNKPDGTKVFALPPVTDVQWALSAPAYDAAPYDMSADPNRSFRNALEGWWRALPDGTRYADPVDHQHCGPDGTSQGTRDGGGLHNRVHTWSGGIVADVPSGTVFGTMMLPTSPADPLFFLNHANIDRLWAKWQTAHPDASFEPAGLADAPIEPFPVRLGTFTPASTWDGSSLGYTYSDYEDSDDAPAVEATRTGPAQSTPPPTYICELPHGPVATLRR